MGADISVESVTGKLNRVGYDAFIQALRQAKGAGNRNIELAIGCSHLLQKDRTDLALDRRSFQARPRQAAGRRDGCRQRLSQERNRDAGHFQPGRRCARSRLALCDAAVWRDADPHRPSARRDAQIARTEARAAPRFRGVRQDFRRRTGGRPSLDLGRIRGRQSAADGRFGLGRGGRRWNGRRAGRQGHHRARSVQPGSDREGQIRARWTRSSAATRKSARSSTC